MVQSPGCSELLSVPFVPSGASPLGSLTKVGGGPVRGGNGKDMIVLAATSIKAYRRDCIPTSMKEWLIHCYRGDRFASIINSISI